MARRTIRSISVPIVLGSVTLPLSMSLLVGWTLFTARNISETHEAERNVWLLVFGVISFAVIMSALVMFTIFLAREILEVRRQDSFIDSVTHELKSPLASLKLCLQTLGRTGLDPDRRESLRTMMLDDVDRLANFIDDVLNASRLAHEGDRVGIDLSDVDAHALVHRCAESVSTRHKVAIESIRIEVPAGLVVTTDRAALEIVVRNLLDNAVKYSDAEPSIDVTMQVDPRRNEAVIEVRDQGIGIPKADLDRIFQRFYRVPHERVNSRKGTGLGLFVVSALVRNLGGKVDARSDGPGRGATMRVRLPSGAAK